MSPSRLCCRSIHFNDDVCSPEAAYYSLLFARTLSQRLDLRSCILVFDMPQVHSHLALRAIFLLQWSREAGRLYMETLLVSTALDARTLRSQTNPWFRYLETCLPSLNMIYVKTAMSDRRFADEYLSAEALIDFSPCHPSMNSSGKRSSSHTRPISRPCCIVQQYQDHATHAGGLSLQERHEALARIKSIEQIYHKPFHRDNDVWGRKKLYSAALG